MNRPRLLRPGRQGGLGATGSVCEGIKFDPAFGFGVCRAAFLGRRGWHIRRRVFGVGGKPHPVNVRDLDERDELEVVWSGLWWHIRQTRLKQSYSLVTTEKCPYQEYSRTSKVCACPPGCLPACPSTCSPGCLPACPSSVCLPVRLVVCLAVWLCLAVCVLGCLPFSGCLCVRLSVCLVPSGCRPLSGCLCVRLSVCLVLSGCLPLSGQSAQVQRQVRFEKISIQPGFEPVFCRAVAAVAAIPLRSPCMHCRSRGRRCRDRFVLRKSVFNVALSTASLQRAQVQRQVRLQRQARFEEISIQPGLEH